jgi:hypothetical protein
MVNIENLSDANLDEFNKILDSTAFWKHAQGESAPIRAACYKFIHSCCKTHPLIIEPRIEMVSTQFLANAFTEASASCHSELWGAILSIITKFPDSWDFSSATKPMSVSLVDFFKGHAKNSPHASFPCLLPLIGSIKNSALISENYTIHKELLPGFLKSGEKLKMDEAAAKLFLETYYECWLFLALPLEEGAEMLAVMNSHFMLPLSINWSTAFKLPIEVLNEVSVSFLAKYLNNKSTTEFHMGALRTSVIRCCAAMIKPAIGKESGRYEHRDICTRLASWFLCLSSSLGKREYELSLVSEMIEPITSQVTTLASSAIPGLLSLLDSILLNFKEVLITETVTKLLFGFLITTGFELLTSDSFAENILELYIHSLISMSSLEGLLVMTKKYWDTLITKIEMFDALTTMKHYDIVFSEVAKSELSQRIDTRSGYIERNILNWIQWDMEYPQPELISVVSYCVSAPSTSPIISAESFEKLVDLTETILQSTTRSLLIIPDRTCHIVSANNIYGTLFLLKVVKKVLMLVKAEPTIDSLCKKIYFDTLQLTTFSHISIATLRWKDESPEDVSGLFQELNNLAKECCDGICKYFALHNNLSLVAITDHWLEQYDRAFFDINHCASVSDHRTHLLALYSFAKEEGSQKHFWNTICKTQDFWLASYKPFETTPDCTMMVKDPFLAWYSLLSCDKVLQSDIKFDLDGLSEYSRLSLLFLALLHRPEFVRLASECSPWLLIELQRFRFVLLDAAYPSCPSPFDKICALKTDEVAGEVMQICKLVADAFLFTSAGAGGIKSRAFTDAFNRCDSAVTANSINHARVLRSILASYLEKRTLDVNAGSLRTLLLSEKVKKSLLLKSAVIDSVPCDAVFADSLKEMQMDLFSESIEYLLDVEKSDYESDVKYEEGTLYLKQVCSHLILLNHISQGGKYSISAKVSGRILRRIRTWYDSKVVDVETTTFNAHHSLLETQVAWLLKSTLASIHASVNLSMKTFIVQLVYFWLTYLASDVLNAQTAPMLVQVLGLVSLLDNFYEEDPDEWRKVKEMDRDYLLIKSFLLSSSTVAEEACATVMEGIAITESKFQPLVNLPRFYYMTSSSCEAVQKAAYRLLHDLVGLKIQTNSLQIEMHPIEDLQSQIVYHLEEALVERLRCKMSLEDNISLLFGYLACWMVLFDHFVDAVFNLNTRRLS